MPDAVMADLETGYYVYGVVTSDALVPGLEGLDGEEVEYVSHGNLAAAVSRFVLDRPPGRRAELMAHSAVVDALAGAGGVVPVQFGSVLGDAEGEVERFLIDGEARFTALLDGLRGRVQLNLRANYFEDQVLTEIVQADPAIAELRRRTRKLPEGTMHPDLVELGEAISRALTLKRDQDTGLLLEGVLPFVEEYTLRAGGGVEHLLDVALLVEESRLGDLEDHLEELAEAVHERIRLRLVGPVAPYDFVEGITWD